MTIKLFEDKEMWDKFVDQSRDGLLFHKWDSLKIMEKHTNCILLPYGIYNGNELICIFPLFFKRSKGLKMIFSSPPRTGVLRLGFVMNREFYSLKQSKKENYLNIVAEGFDEEIKKISPNYVSINLVQNFLDVRSFEWKNYGVHAHITYITDLSSSLDEIWNGFTKVLRNQIKQINASNVKLLRSNDISAFFESEQKRYEKKGLNHPIISKNYLQDLFETYPEHFKLIHLCDSNNNIITAQINNEYKDRFVQWLGGARPQKNTHYNEYMTWEFIKQAKNSGYKNFDWGGGTKAISQFKSKFNPSLGIYFNIYKKDTLGKFAEWAYMNFIQKIIGIV